MIEYKVIVDEAGNIFWYLNDMKHREDGPAVEYHDGSEIWYRHGLLHREDGPAKVYANGDRLWYINGINISKNDFYAKELTVADIEKLLGHKVKIVNK